MDWIARTVRAQRGIAGRIDAGVKQLGSVARPLRGLLIVTLILVTILYFPQQTRELYLGLAEQSKSPPYYLGIASLAFVAVILFLETLQRLAPPTSSSRVRYLIAACLATAPMTGLALGIWETVRQHRARYLSVTSPSSVKDTSPNAIDEHLATISQQTQDLLPFALTAAGVTLLSIVAAVFLVTRKGAQLRYLSVALTTSVVIWFLAAPLIPDAVGAIAQICMFFSAIILAMGYLRRAETKTHLPISPLVLIAAILFLLLDLNNNRRIRSISTVGEVAGSPAWELEDAFMRWLASRRDMDYYRSQQRPYPVYLVAAQGGGIYAAANASIVLGRLQDACPIFSQHIFAISGVSGGAIGASIFAATSSLKADNAEWRPCMNLTSESGLFEVTATRVVGSDFLSPIIAAFLPDILQRFVAFPISNFDRARALEFALERAWGRASMSNGAFSNGGQNVFGAPFRTAWNPHSAMPALLLAATEAQTGGRVVFSPFDLSKLGIGDLLDYSELLRRGHRGRDTSSFEMPLSTVAILSARFPGILPPAEALGLALVDGGYYDSSGALTAMDLLKGLQSITTKNNLKVAFRLILLTSAKADVFAGVRSGERVSQPSDLLSPVSALFSSRDLQQQRIVSGVVDEFRKQAQSPEACLDDGNCLRLMRLDHETFNLPLGWNISNASLRSLSFLSGRAGSCRRGSVDKSDSISGRIVNENNCTACDIIRDLSPSAASLCEASR